MTEPQFEDSALYDLLSEIVKNNQSGRMTRVNGFTPERIAEIVDSRFEGVKGYEVQLLFTYARNIGLATYLFEMEKYGVVINLE